jgi:predicted amidophosphoribosyltransferase
METCPVCRALLNGTETCRRCRAELKTAQALERQAQQLAGAAMHSILLGDRAGAARLLRRAHVVHATLEVQILSAILDESARRDDWGPHSPTESISSA